VVDEFAFLGEEARGSIPALLRAAAGDLRRIVGWLHHLPAERSSSRMALMLIVGSSPMVEGISFFAATRSGLVLVAVMSIIFAGEA
jgi:hypothetical protein